MPVPPHIASHPGPPPHRPTSYFGTVTFLHDCNVKSRTLYDDADIGDSFLWSEWGKELATLRPVNKQQTTKKNCVLGQDINFCPKSSKGVRGEREFPFLVIPKNAGL